MYYVALDVGCIECSEPSYILGIFTSLDEAKAVIEEHRIRQEKKWIGQHVFSVEEIEELNKIYKVEY